MADSFEETAESYERIARDVNFHDERIAIGTNFNEPWEARAFALAVALSQAGRFAWRELRERLVAEIAEADIANADGRPRPTYYECWLRALEAVLEARGIASTSEIERHANTIAANPPTPTKALSSGPVKVA
jgi:nitrile hydratase accessory protein